MADNPENVIISDLWFYNDDDDDDDYNDTKWRILHARLGT